MNWIRGFILTALAAVVPFFSQSIAAEINTPVTSKEIASRTIEDGGTGAFKAVMASDESLPTHTIFRPNDLAAAASKSKLPIVVWGNGACANSPWEHVNFLSEIASHGYLVVAIGAMPAEGQKGAAGGPTKSPLLTDAMNWAFAQNADRSSQYFQKLDTNKVAVAGMSCGGLQTLETAPDPRISILMVCNSGLFTNPATARSGMPNLGKDQLTKIHTPTIYILGGEKDIAYNNGRKTFGRKSEASF
jgi:dienelactone hydrolase